MKIKDNDNQSGLPADLQLDTSAAYSLHAHLKVDAAFGRHARCTAILYFHKHSGFVPEETFLNNQLSASGDAIPG